MEKDITGNELIANNDVFADILNANHLLGKYQVAKEDLVSIPTDFSYQDLNGKNRKLFRDRIKELKKYGISILFIGLENQTGINNIMPIRDMGYAYTAYMRQIDELTSENIKSQKPAYTKVLHDDQRLKPVLTFILYFGTNPWKRPLSLMDLLDITEDQKENLKNYLQDYKINVIPMRNQPEEIRKRYKSDFRIIANILACHGKENLKQYIQNDKQPLLHTRQTLNMLNAFCNAKYIKKMYNNYIEHLSVQKEETSMQEKEQEMTLGEMFDGIFEDMEAEITEQVTKKVTNQFDTQREQILQMQAEVNQQKAEVDQQKAEVDQQKAEVDQQKAEVDQQKAEVDQQKAEVDQQKAEVDQQKAEVDQQKKFIIHNLMAIWDIPTISAKTGFSLNEVEALANKQ